MSAETIFIDFIIEYFKKQYLAKKLVGYLNCLMVAMGRLVSFVIGIRLIDYGQLKISTVSLRKI